MPDISMCMNHTCPHRMECYRYRAVPSEYRQAYALFSPGDALADGTPKCLWPLDGRKVAEKQE